ncbi:MAG: RNA 2',3'-cyclic phosphodiesterase [Desulfobacterales bacterium]|jgi:2'-5' RNA ligase
MRGSDRPDAFRAFIALALPHTVIDFLEKVQHCLAGQGLRARWVRPAGMHLTLKFLGPLPPEKVAAVQAVLRAVAARHPALRLTVHGLGGFPNRRRPRVLWMGVSGDSTPLVDLQRDIDDGLTTLGWLPEKRSFRGHLTIARAKGRRPFDPGIGKFLTRCEPSESVSFRGQNLGLYRSELRPAGAVYDIISQVALGASAA